MTLTIQLSRNGTFSAAEKRIFNDIFRGDHHLERYAIVFRIYEGKTLAGVAGVTYRMRVLPSLFLGFSHGYRGKGLGTAFLEKILHNWGRPVFLTVYKDNASAIHLYKKFGFKQLMTWKRKKLLMFRW